MKILCLTADDFGIDPGIDAGILRCLGTGPDPHDGGNGGGATATAAPEWRTSSGPLLWGSPQGSVAGRPLPFGGGGGNVSGGPASSRPVRNVSVWLDALSSPFPPEVGQALRNCCVGLHWHLFPPAIDLNRPGDWIRAGSFVWPDSSVIARELERLDSGWEALERQNLHPAFVNGHQHVHLHPAWIVPLSRWAVGRGIRMMRMPRELGPGSWGSRLRRPGLFVLELLGRLGTRLTRRLPLRWVPAICRWGRSLPLLELETALDGIVASPLEIVVHPGLPTESYQALSRAPIDFRGLMETLTSPDLPPIVNRRGFRFGRLDEAV